MRLSENFSMGPSHHAEQFHSWQILENLTPFELCAKFCNLTPWSFFSNGSHVFCKMKNPKIVKNVLNNIHAKFFSIHQVVQTEKLSMGKKYISGPVTHSFINGYTWKSWRRSIPSCWTILSLCKILAKIIVLSYFRNSAIWPL